jgi:hypothetical protein
LAEVTCHQVGGPIAFREFQLADDRIDSQPFLCRQFVPRHLQIHASLARPGLDEKRGITSWRPAEGYSEGESGAAARKEALGYAGRSERGESIRQGFRPVSSPAMPTA